jgi:hypothetical protein
MCRSSIDLVMYVPGSKEAGTVQVKTKLSPESGSTGHPTIGASFPHACKAQWLAVVDLSRDMAWLFSIDEARELAQQERRDGTSTLYWFTDGFIGRKTKPESDMEQYRLEAVARNLLDCQPAQRD